MKTGYSYPVLIGLVQCIPIVHKRVRVYLYILPNSPLAYDRVAIPWSSLYWPVRGNPDVILQSVG